MQAFQLQNCERLTAPAMRFYEHFQEAKLLTLFPSFWINFTYLCLQQVYGVFSPHLFPAFDHFWILVIAKNKLTSVSYVSVLLLMINFVITLSNLLWNHSSVARGSTATLTMLCRNLSSIRRQTHEKLSSICSISKTYLKERNSFYLD